MWHQMNHEVVEEHMHRTSIIGCHFLWLNYEDLVWSLTKIDVVDDVSYFASGLKSIHEAYYIEFDL